MNGNKNCLYNVYLLDGVHRMSGFAAQREYGAGIWDTDAIDHSEWCERRECVEGRNAAVPAGIFNDPFMVEGVDSTPPF